MPRVHVHDNDFYIRPEAYEIDPTESIFERLNTFIASPVNSTKKPLLTQLLEEVDSIVIAGDFNMNYFAATAVTRLAPT